MLSSSTAEGNQFTQHERARVHPPALPSPLHEARQRSDLVRMLTAMQSDQASLWRMAGLLNNPLSPNGVLESVAREVAGLLDADLCCGGLVKEDGSLETAIRCDRNGPTQTGGDVRESMLLQLLAEGENRTAAAGGPRGPPSAIVQRSCGDGCIAVVLPIWSGLRLLGTLAACTHLPTGVPDLPLRALNTLNALGNLAAVAIERGRLHDELRLKEGHIDLLLKATIDAQEQERERICLEVHDGVAQSLIQAFQYMQVFESTPEAEIPQAMLLIHRATTMVKQALREVREVISTLRPAMLDDLGLVSAVRNELYDVQKQTGWQIEFVADQARWPRSVETALYRIVHEALSNALKHAQTQYLRVELRESSSRIVAQVVDHGVGFTIVPWRSPWRGGKGIGLLSMRKRAELLGGSCEIRTVPGEGTTVRVEVPLTQQENDDGADNSLDCR